MSLKHIMDHAHLFLIARKEMDSSLVVKMEILWFGMKVTNVLALLTFKTALL